MDKLNRREMLAASLGAALTAVVPVPVVAAPVAALVDTVAEEWALTHPDCSTTTLPAIGLHDGNYYWNGEEWRKLSHGDWYWDFRLQAWGVCP